MELKFEKIVVYNIIDGKLVTKITDDDISYPINDNFLNPLELETLMDVILEDTDNYCIDGFANACKIVLSGVECSLSLTLTINPAVKYVLASINDDVVNSSLGKDIVFGNMITYEEYGSVDVKYGTVVNYIPKSRFKDGADDDIEVIDHETGEIVYVPLSNVLKITNDKNDFKYYEKIFKTMIDNQDGYHHIYWGIANCPNYEIPIRCCAYINTTDHCDFRKLINVKINRLLLSDITENMLRKHVYNALIDLYEQLTADGYKINKITLYPMHNNVLNYRFELTPSYLGLDFEIYKGNERIYYLEPVAYPVGAIIATTASEFVILGKITDNSDIQNYKIESLMEYNCYGDYIRTDDHPTIYVPHERIYVLGLEEEVGK